MEPIRPDDDELRAERPQPPTATSDRGKKAQQAGGGKGGRGPDRRPGNGLLYLLILVVVVAGAGLWYQQQRHLESMADQLEETENWMRQSKLALARFEGDLTETGQTIDARGSTLEQRLQDQQEEIKAASSEIRKLWVIAYEKNRPMLEEHSRLLSAQGERLTAVAEKQEKQSAELSAVSGSLAQQDQKLAGVTASVGELEEKLGKQAARDAELSSRTDALQKELAAVSENVENRLKRFVQEQKLAAGGLEGRVSALERELQELESAQNQLRQTEQRLSRVEGAIEAIDAARAQLTSRLVRLSEQVDQLRQNQ